MPTVPRYGEQRVDEAAIPRPRLSTDVPEYSVGIGGRSMSEAARVIRDVQDYERKKADQVVLLNADSQLSEFESSYLYDPNTGALNKKGTSAFGLPEQVMSEFEKRTQDIEKGLASDEQKIAFGLLAQRRRSDINRTIQRHVSEQISEVDRASTDSFIANERDAAARNFTDIERIAVSIDRQTAAYEQFAARNGMPREWTEEKTRLAVSNTHELVIERLVNTGNDRVAKSYFDENRNELTGETGARLEKVLKEGSNRGESQRQADVILAKHGSSRTDALAKAKEITDPEIRDLVVTRLDQEFARAEQIENQQRQDAFRTASGIVEQHGDVRAIPPSLWTSFDAHERKSLSEFARYTAEGTDPITDIDLYYRLKTQASSAETRDEFLKTNLLMYKPALSRGDFKEVADLQANLRSAIEKSDKAALDGVLANDTVRNRIVTRGLTDVLGKPVRDLNDKELSRANQFRRYIDDKVRALEVQKKAPATDQEVQDLVDRSIIEGEITGLIWNSKARLFEAGPDDEFSPNVETLDDVPAGERESITAALKDEGVPVTDEAIIELYIAGLKSGK